MSFHIGALKTESGRGASASTPPRSAGASCEWQAETAG